MDVFIYLILGAQPGFWERKTTKVYKKFLKLFWSSRLTEASLGYNCFEASL